MTNKQDEVLEDKFRERLDNGIDETLEALKENQHYNAYLERIAENISNNDIEKLLENQMTVHNIELEAVYRAGHRDCIFFLKEIKDKKEI